MMWEDPIVEEVRKIRRDLDAKFNFDATEIFKDIRNRQASLGPRLVCRKKEFSPEQATTPNDHDDYELRDAGTNHTHGIIYGHP